MNMRKHLYLILATLLFIGSVAVIIPGCNKDNDTECQTTIDRINQNGYLLAGTTGDYHPLNFPAHRY